MEMRRQKIKGTGRARSKDQEMDTDCEPDTLDSLWNSSTIPGHSASSFGANFSSGEKVEHPSPLTRLWMNDELASGQQMNTASSSSTSSSASTSSTATTKKLSKSFPSTQSSTISSNEVEEHRIPNNDTTRQISQTGPSPSGMQGFADFSCEHRACIEGTMADETLNVFQPSRLAQEETTNPADWLDKLERLFQPSWKQGGNVPASANAPFPNDAVLKDARIPCANTNSGHPDFVLSNEILEPRPIKPDGHVDGNILGMSQPDALLYSRRLESLPFPALSSYAREPVAPNGQHHFQFPPRGGS